jgi:hypothetical protein
MIYILLIFIAAIFLGAYLSYYQENKFSISFMETFNLTEMPIVTMFAGDSKINFLLDTGSTQSYISGAASDLITGKEAMCNMQIISAQGSAKASCKVIDTVLTYKDKDFDIRLFVNSGLDTSFEDIKQKKGITLHGVIGSDFLDKYSYIIDFEKYLAYPKK